MEALSQSIGGELNVYACVATDYGKELLPTGLDHIRIRSGRLTEDEMTALMEENRFDAVIDTTHPYADAASENIKAACGRAGCEYIRVLRASGADNQEGCLFFGSHEAVAEYLDQTEGNVLLAIGSKELTKYTKVRDYQSRLYARVLPMVEVVENCYILGFTGEKLICMQGPFTADLNTALIRQVNARYVVTKDSGEPGGFQEKYRAAKETGVELLVIGRQKEEEGISLEELLKRLENTFHIPLRELWGAQQRKQDKMEIKEENCMDKGHWFPVFTNLSGKTITVVGAGKIAKRRIETLMKFDCRIRVVAMEALPEIKTYATDQKLELKLKPYEASDLEGADYVLAATNDKELNHGIYESCREGNIPVNVADSKEKSDFYFPGIIRKNGITVGVTADGRDHALAKKAVRIIDDCLETGLLQD